MLCDLCKKNMATVHLTQIVEGKTKKVDLCEGCSKAKGVDDPAGFSLADLLMGLGNPQDAVPSPDVAGATCPVCGFTQQDFKKNGRLGCADCYVAFEEGLESLLKTMHKGVQHVGKVPQSMRISQDYAERLRSSQKRLEKAISQEDFEQAAILRDEIKQLKEKYKTLAPG